LPGGFFVIIAANLLYTDLTDQAEEHGYFELVNDVLFIP
jgi:hypothetical protein